MKKNIFRIGIFMVLTIAFAIIMPKVTFAATIDSIDITVPEPVIGEKLTTDASKIQVTDEKNNNWIINQIDWYNDQETQLNNNEACNATDKYKVEIEILKPLDIDELNANPSISFNGKELKKLEDYTMGERILDNVSYQSIIVTYNFGHAKVQKEISKIEITTPTPVIGKKLDTNISNYQVKIDGNEILKIEDVEWLSEDYQKLDSDTVEEGKKYVTSVHFKVPNKYGMNSNVVITVNGEQLHFENMASNEFNYATAGDDNFDDAFVCKVMEAKKEDKEEPTEEIKEESKQEENENSKAEEENKNEEPTANQTELKNPKTGDTIVTTLSILTLSVIGLAFTINNIKKQNK